MVVFTAPACFSIMPVEQQDDSIPAEDLVPTEEESPVRSKTDKGKA
jgi:hypothetical protein